MEAVDRAELLIVGLLRLLIVSTRTDDPRGLKKSWHTQGVQFRRVMDEWGAEREIAADARSRTSPVTTQAASLRGGPA